jgi:hypothetical protein
MPESITFLTIYLNPLFATSMALLLAAMLLGERALRRGGLASAAGAGLAALLLANIHTYDVVPLVAVLTTWLVITAGLDNRWDWRRARAYGLILGLALPAVLWQAHLIRSDPLYAAKANTLTPTPGLLTMLLTCGLLTPLALWGAVLGGRRRHGPSRFLATWAAVHFLCLFLPLSLFPFQRKMAEGLHLPLAILAAAGLYDLCRRLATVVAYGATLPEIRRHGRIRQVLEDLAARRAAWLRPLLAAGLLLLMPSNLVFVADSLDNVASNNQEKTQRALMPPFCLPEVDMEAIAWLDHNLPPDAVILCLPLVGNYLPGLTGRRVYVGHWAETIDFGRKLGEYQHFMRGGGSAQEKAQWLRDNGITYVYYGWYEHNWTENQRPLLPGLERVYPEHGGLGSDNAPVTIFRVKSEAEMAASGEPQP